MRGSWAITGVIATVLVAGGCAQTPELDAPNGAEPADVSMSEGDAAQPGAMLVVPGRSVGPVHLGMSRDDVVAAWGQPMRADAPTAVQYRDAIAITYNQQDQVTAILGGWACGGETPEALAHPFVGQFEGGFGMGATMTQVRDMLGEPQRTRSYEEAPEVSNWIYDTQGVRMSFRAGRLYHLTIVPRREQAGLARDG